MEAARVRAGIARTAAARLGGGVEFRSIGSHRRIVVERRRRAPDDARAADGCDAPAPAAR
jgi:hypothetical protein